MGKLRLSGNASKKQKAGKEELFIGYAREIPAPVKVIAIFNRQIPSCLFN